MAQLETSCQVVRGHTEGNWAARAHLAMRKTQVRRQQVSDVASVAELSQIEGLQDLTVAAASHSHNASLQKRMNT